MNSETTMAVSDHRQSLALKGYFIPYLALGHIIPMVDIANLFAGRGVDVTIFLTPHNAATVREDIDQAASLGQKIKAHIIQFPFQEVGLPEGVESTSSAPDFEVAAKVFRAFLKLQQPIEQVIREAPPDFVVADMHCFWTSDLALQLGIPRLTFSARPYFALCAEHNILHYQPYRDLQSDDEQFEIPDLPDKIVMKKSELAEWIRVPNGYSLFMSTVRESDRKSYGVIVNSFDELESTYGDYHKNVMGRKAWAIGPLSLSNKDESNKKQRGRKTTIDDHVCMSWLDSKEPNSVLYVSFGSSSKFSSPQLLELASILGACGHPFIWVVRKEGIAETSEEASETDLGLQELEKKFEESKIGLIVKGWAPQLLILEHPAIGGFMTHCGGNSMLESIAAGVPMITWPLSSEQFYNEKMITQILKIGVEVGVGRWSYLIEESKAFVSKQKIAKAIKEVMGDQEESKLMRERSKKLGVAAKNGVDEGGSSYNNLTHLIQELNSISSNGTGF